MFSLARRSRAAMTTACLWGAFASACSGSLGSSRENDEEGRGKGDEDGLEDADDIIDGTPEAPITQCDKAGPSPISRLSRAAFGGLLPPAGHRTQGRTPGARGARQGHLCHLSGSGTLPRLRAQDPRTARDLGRPQRGGAACPHRAGYELTVAVAAKNDVPPGNG